MSYYDAAYSTLATIENTKHYTQDILTRNIPGALVECGVGRGSQLAAMHEVCKATRWIFGFDSFEGIPLASKDDEVQPGIGPKQGIPYNHPNELLRSSGVTVHSERHVRSMLNRWTNNNSGNIILVKGWFQHTLHRHRETLQRAGGIALLRLDGDLYESTLVSLVELFPLLNDGGILIIDDWLLAGCKKACQRYASFFSMCQIQPPHGTEKDGPAYFIKRSVPALQYRQNVFSQNGEDGIFRKLLSRLQSPTKWVCEFGAWDGKECSNTFRLVKDEGYNAVYIEGREDYYQLLLKTCSEYPSIIPLHAMVAYEGDNTLDDLLSKTPIPLEFDILSIDIDSYDYQVWRSVEVYKPKLVIIEINSSVSPIDKTHIHGPGKEGTGFYPMVELGLSKGYTLLCHTGNLIFVRNDLKDLYSDMVIPPFECHRSAWIFNS
jgi:hypothetical protein